MSVPPSGSAVAPAAVSPTSDPQEPSFATFLTRILGGHDLSAEDAETAFRVIVDGRATHAQTAGLLVALRSKGEAPSEVAGGVRALRQAMVRVPLDDTRDVVDTCGTGGGRMNTFNISTAAAFVAAGAGVRIAKHGNRSHTSRSGSADVLEALGVPIDIEPERMPEILEEAGIVFMFAPRMHPAMRHVAPVRRELGVPTIMNVLGPLTNPAGARRQVVGVSDPALLELVAGALLELGHDHALVVHGEPGMDELSPIGATDILEVRGGTIHRSRFDPAGRLGWAGLDPAGLAGAEPADNARIILDILSGRTKGAARAAVALNAGAAIYVAGKAPTLEDGVAEAERAIDAGLGVEAVDRLRAASRRTAPAA